jgi:hypothetical protein
MDRCVICQQFKDCAIQVDTQVDAGSVAEAMVGGICQECYDMYVSKGPRAERAKRRVLVALGFDPAAQ